MKEKELQVLRMQCYHFEAIRSEKKLFFFSSIVNSFYSGHCWDLELLSSLARVRYGGNLFQSNICKIMRRARKRGPPIPLPFSLSSLPLSLHPLPLSPTFYGSEKVEKPSGFVIYSHFKDSAFIAV